MFAYLKLKFNLPVSLRGTKEENIIMTVIHSLPKTLKQTLGDFALPFYICMFPSTQTPFN